MPLSAPRLRPRFGAGGAGVAGSSFSVRDLGAFLAAGWLSAASSDALASTSAAVGPSSSASSAFFFARVRLGFSAVSAAATLSTPVVSAAWPSAGFFARERLGLASGCSACSAAASSRRGGLRLLGLLRGGLLDPALLRI